jgi:DNA ligase 1
MELDKIYKADVTGKVRVWQAEIGEGDMKGYWRVHHGVLNGEITTSSWTEVELKSQSSLFEQALFYAKSEMKKKLRMDYRMSIDDIGETRFSFIRPMLAHTYGGWQRPCFVQPKLDGVRGLTNRDGIWTRGNKQLISAPHIEGILKPFFNLWPNIVLDGELYNHDLHDNFNKIISLSKKTIPSFEDLEESAMHIEYWVFDMCDIDHPKAIFEERWEFLQINLFDHNFHKIVQTPTQFVTTEEELDIYNIELLEQGFEGQIIRYSGKYEEGKRSQYMLKRKEYVDQEFALKAILSGEGNWEGFAKIAVCEMPDGREFRAGIKGTKEFTLQLLEDKDKYHSVTVKYQALTPDGIPRFPIATKFWEEMFDGMEDIIKPKRDLFA